MSVFFRPLWLLALLIFSCVAYPAPVPEKPPGPKEVAQLIERLGSPDFKERQAATKSLEVIGELALDALRKAVVESKDPGVRRRAEDLAEAITEEVMRSSKVRRFEGPRVAVSHMAFSPDIRHVLVGSGEAYPGEKQELVDHTLRLWKMESGQELFQARAHPGRIGSLAFSPDGLNGLSTGFEEGDTTVRLWDLKEGREMHSFTGHKYPVYSARFSPDGRRILTTSSDITMRLWDVKTGGEVRRFDQDARPAAVFSPDGKRILAWSGDRAIRLWDAETGKELGCFGSDWFFPALAFSPDGRRGVFGDLERSNGRPGEPRIGRLQLWDLESGKLLRAFEGHREMVLRVAFSPDAQRVLSASRDGDIRLWDAESGKELRRLKPHRPIVLAATFSSDGRQILTGHTDNTVQVWATPK